MSRGVGNAVNYGKNGRADDVVVDECGRVTRKAGNYLCQISRYLDYLDYLVDI